MSTEVRQPTRLSLSVGPDGPTLGYSRDLGAMESPLDAYRDINALLQKALQEIKAGPVKPNFSEPQKSALAKEEATPTDMEKFADGFPWAKGKTPGRQWVRLAGEAEEMSDRAKLLAHVRANAVNGYCTIGSHVYRIEGDFIGRYPKREAGAR